MIATARHFAAYRGDRQHRFISEWNEIAHPFAWKPKSFEKILAKIVVALPAAA